MLHDIPAIAAMSKMLAFHTLYKALSISRSFVECCSECKLPAASWTVWGKNCLLPNRIKTDRKGRLASFSGDLASTSLAREVKFVIAAVFSTWGLNRRQRPKRWWIDDRLSIYQLVDDHRTLNENIWIIPAFWSKFGAEAKLLNA